MPLYINDEKTPCGVILITYNAKDNTGLPKPIPLQFKELTQNHIQRQQIINETYADITFNNYLRQSNPQNSKSFIVQEVNNKFLDEKLEQIQQELAKKQNGGRTKKRLRKHTHNRRRKMKKQTKRRNMHSSVRVQ